MALDNLTKILFLLSLTITSLLTTKLYGENEMQTRIIQKKKSNIVSLRPLYVRRIINDIKVTKTCFLLSLVVNLSSKNYKFHSSIIIERKHRNERRYDLY